MNIKKKLTASLLALGLLWLMPTTAQAGIITGSGVVQGFAVSASADFEVVGGNLQITLTNTAATTAAPSAVLSNIEFNLNSGVVFNALNSSVTAAVLANQGAVYALNQNISGGYGFATNVTYAGSPTDQFGISSVSFTNAGATTPIGGTFLPGIGGNHPNSLDGVDYGVIANVASSGNGGLNNQGPLAANSVVITMALANGSAAIDLNQLSGVYFSYGSEQTGVPGGFIPGPNPVPVPPTIVLALSGLASIGLAGLRRFRRRVVAGA